MIFSYSHSHWLNGTPAQTFITLNVFITIVELPLIAKNCYRITFMPYFIELRLVIPLPSWKENKH